ncbi:Tetratricopeptide (TPR) repeat [Candidatus Methanophagaceae archaeon]|nr:Tetratricopeptide (TPR) repeat [Methanophagales archaeon]
MTVDKDADEWISKGNELFSSQGYMEAIKYYDKAISIDPNYALIRRNKGLALYLLGKNDEAIECFDTAIAIDPNYADALIHKGNALYKLGKNDEAIKCFDKAIAIDPNSVDSWTIKGLALYLLGKNDEAIECFDKAITIDPNSAWAWYGKGIASQKLKKYAEALECSANAIEHNPNDPYPLILKGNILRATGDYSEAEHCYNEALTMDQKNIEALVGLRFIYSDFTYEFDKALQIACRVLEINPDFVEKINIAEILIKLGRYEEGRKYALQAINETQDTVYKGIIGFLISSSYLLEGDTTKGGNELATFLDDYMGPNGDFKVEEGRWIFRGLINVISESNANLQTKFLLLTLIDLIQGKVDRNKLSFFLPQ